VLADRSSRVVAGSMLFAHQFVSSRRIERGFGAMVRPEGVQAAGQMPDVHISSRR